MSFCYILFYFFSEKKCKWLASFLFISVSYLKKLIKKSINVYINIFQSSIQILRELYYSTINELKSRADHTSHSSAKNNQRVFFCWTSKCYCDPNSSTLFTLLIWWSRRTTTEKSKKKEEKKWKTLLQSTHSNSLLIQLH